MYIVGRVVILKIEKLIKCLFIDKQFKKRGTMDLYGMFCCVKENEFVLMYYLEKC